ncbi:MAG: hypothetical protein Q9187_004258 [Circinaria calcarea]
MPCLSNPVEGYDALSNSEPDGDDIDKEKLSTLYQKSRRRYPSSLVCVAVTCLAVGFAVGLLLRQTSRTSVSSRTVCGDPIVRHEWRSLSKVEKDSYLQAVQYLRTVPSTLGLNQSLYDDFSYIHTRTGEEAHYTAAFLSWHRWFLHIYEDALRQQCGYTGHLTYWDWSLDWEDITLAPVWDAQFGFGGNGNTSDSFGFRGFCVTDGPFARLEAPFIGPMEVPHCLSRSFLSGENLTEYAQRIRPTALEKVLGASTYEEFNLALETGPHLSIPFSIHGDFSVPTAPQDPVFFLHHTQLDRLWWKWQQGDLAKRLEDYTGRAVFNSTEKVAGLGDSLSYGNLGPSVKVSEIMDTRAGPLCYVY